jgi:hypothetical protein
MHHMRAGGAMDHNFDALQGEHPVGLRSDVANCTRRRRRRTADDTEDDMTKSREILHDPLPDEAGGARYGNHCHGRELESKPSESGKLISTRTIISEHGWR